MPSTPIVPQHEWLKAPQCEVCFLPRTKDRPVSSWADSDGKRRCVQCKLQRTDSKIEEYRQRAYARASGEHLSEIDRARIEKQRVERLLERQARSVGLTVGEYLLQQELLAAGYRVYRHGWPDFLVVTPDGEIEFVEHKSPNDSLRPAQIAIHELLRKAGLRVRVEFR